MDKPSDKLRVNPRKSWYRNLEQVTTNGDYEVTFHLKRPQPAFLTLLAGGCSPIYPCHVPAAQMRQHPIGTGPFKFVEFKPNESIKVTREPGLLEAGPALSRRHRIHDDPGPVDGGAGLYRRQVRHDVPLHPALPLLKDVQSQMPQAHCEVTPAAASTRQLLVNRDKPPFNNLGTAARNGAQRSTARPSSTFCSEGQGEIGGVVAAAAGRAMGHAAGNAEDTARLRPRYREEPRRGAPDHAEARLRARQAR